MQGQSRQHISQQCWSTSPARERGRESGPQRTELRPQALDVVQRSSSRVLPPLSARLECIAQHLLLRQPQPRPLEVDPRRAQLSLDNAELVSRLAQLLLARRQEAEVLLELVARRLELRLGDLELSLGLVIVAPALFELVPRLLRDEDALVAPCSLRRCAFGKSAHSEQSETRWTTHVEVGLEPLDLGRELVQENVARHTLVDLWPVLDRLGLVRVRQGRRRLLVADGRDGRDDGRLGSPAERVLQQARQLRFAV